MKSRRVTALSLCALLMAGCTPAIHTTTTLGTDPFPYAGAPTHPKAPATPSPQEENNDSNTGAPRQEPTIRSASGTLHILLDEEAALPQALVADFRETTGVDVEVTSLAQNTNEAVVDVIMGFDAETLATKTSMLASEKPQDTIATHPIDTVPAAVDYARDDVCVLADIQWYAVNKLDKPRNFDSLAEETHAKHLVLAPEESSSAKTFAAHVTKELSNTAATWMARVKGKAATPQSWQQANETSTVRTLIQPGTREVPARGQWAGAEPAPNATQVVPAGQSAAEEPKPQGTHPLRVAPLSVALRATPNTQASLYLQPVADSCAQRYLYAVGAAQINNPDAAEAWIAYLQSERAQKILATTGAALPLHEADGHGTVVDLLNTQARPAD